MEDLGFSGRGQGRKNMLSGSFGFGGEGRSPALTHNLGGRPGKCVSFVSVTGTERSA
jgi:hypothetical protein